MNLNSSSGAWVSAIVITIFSYFIINILKSKKRLKKLIKNKLLVAILILVSAAILILISVQLYLYLNFALRNDILVELTADKENIFFTDNPAEDITFKIDLTMNPFCSAQCDYTFFDISSGREIDRGSLNTTTIFSEFKKYKLENNDFTDGSQEIKRFEVSCTSKKTLFCYTREVESKRAVLITVNYRLSDEEKVFKDDSRNEITSLAKTVYSSSDRLNESLQNLIRINNSFSTENSSTEAKNLYDLFPALNIFLDNAKKLWESEDFDLLENELHDTKTLIEKFENESQQLNSKITFDISLYNNLVENFSKSREILEQISENNMVALICTELNNIVADYNNAVADFKNTLSLPNKKIIAESISAEADKLYSNYLNSDGAITCLLNKSINQENFTRINFVPPRVTPVTFFLKEPDPICCLNRICEKCCNDCSKENYPIIFLHGQSINEAISVGYSFDSFSRIKEKLITEGYIDAGAIVLEPADEKGLWGKINSTLIMTGSYFFDTYKTDDGEKTISSNKEGIDTYALRLRNLIDLVKYRTNKDKVILVTHSMGGVVARRYIQIFGGDNIGKAILVTAPNHGVDDKIRDYCAVIGPEVSCNELDENSVFMKNLNSAPPPKIPIYNIIGIGCNMGDETGDGFIKNSSQYLQSAVNYYFSGTCYEPDFEFFHEYIIFPDRYPEVYAKIYEILKNS